MRARRRFSREFKVEAVKLVTERGVTVAQAARDLGVVMSAASRAAPTSGEVACSAATANLWFTAVADAVSTAGALRGGYAIAKAGAGVVGAGGRVLLANLAGEAGATAGKVGRDAAKAVAASDFLNSAGAAQVANAAASSGARPPEGDGWNPLDIVPFTSIPRKYGTFRSSCPM